MISMAPRLTITKMSVSRDVVNFPPSSHFVFLRPTEVVLRRTFDHLKNPSRP